MSDPCRLTLVEMAEALAARRLSARELVAAHLDRIAAQNPRLRAWVHVDEGAGGGEGLLAGIPIGIKDLIDVRGMPTRAGAAHRPDLPARRDAALVARLRRAGAVILGKQATAEYAVGGTAEHSPRNPWELSRDAGASSSGSAVAVADGHCAAALGTETAGSIRLPAAWCGVAGLVPTRGALPMAGCLPLSPSMDVAGPLTRRVADCALVWRALLPRDPGPVAASARGLRLGLPLSVFAPLPAPAEAALQTALAALADLGAQVRPVDLPRHEGWGDVARTISWSEEYALHGPELRAHPQRFSPVARSRLQDGLRFTGPDYVLALQAQKAAWAVMARVFRSVDLLVLPTVSEPAPPFGYEHQPGARDLSFTRLFNLTGLPCLTLCHGFTPEGLPLGLQLVGPPRSEARLLAVGMALEAALGPGRFPG